MQNVTHSNPTKLCCYHCGEAIKPEGEIVHDNLVFCCSGCFSVYQILSEANLCDLYDREERAVKVKPLDAHKYLALDSPEIAARFIEFNHEGLAKVTFFIPAIHCSSCIWLLEHLDRINSAIVRSTVNFPRREVILSFYTDAIQLKELAILLDSVGYAPQLDLSNQKKKSGKDIVTRLAVAGFCFGNAMLISLPDYMDLDYQIPGDYKSIFAYIILLFSLPVFFYSSSLYFSSAWKGLRHKFINIDVPISIGIFTLFARSVYEIVWLGELGYVDSLAGLVFFLLIGRWYQHKTYQALSFDRDIAAYFPMAVTRLKGSVEEITPIQDLIEDDELLIRNNELIPADGILLLGHANIDYSFVTGESIPTNQEVGTLLFAGGRQLGGPIHIKLTRRVNNSHLTRLWNQSEVKNEKFELQNLSDRISQYFTAAILILATLGALVWYFIDSSQSWQVFSAVLIVACPCASALAIPFTYGHTLRVFGKYGLYLKNSNVVEKLAHIQHIVFDKTGTLTHSLPEQVVYEGADLTPNEKNLVFSAASNSVHPLSKLVAGFLSGSRKLTIDFFDEYAGEGVIARFGTQIVQLGSAEWLKQEAPFDQNSRVYLSINQEFKGYFQFGVAYRDQIFPALEQLKKKYRLSLLSGDKDAQKKTLKPYFDLLRFKQKPLDKKEFISLRRTLENEKVMMVGDGLNDAGALKESYVGISIADDIYQFSPASDGILSAPSINKFPRFLDFSKKAVQIVIAALLISLLYNVVGLTIALMGFLSPIVCAILMPISSVSVVAFITFMVNWQSAKEFEIFPDHS